MTMWGDDAGTRGSQRFEVFTGAGKRRDWPRALKASIVAESYSGTHSVCAVARRHGIASTQLFTWRRELRGQLAERGVAAPKASAPVPSFVPVLIDPVPASHPVPVARRSRRRRRSERGAVELEIDGVSVRIGHGADIHVITAVIEALKAAG